MPDGEQNLVEETVMIEMIENVVKQFANPNYIRPNAKVMTPRATPKLERPDQGNSGGNIETTDANEQAQDRELGAEEKMQIDA